jgi:hypothetical protein
LVQVTRGLVFLLQKFISFTQKFISKLAPRRWATKSISPLYL